jgi:hypothetical protein
MGLGAGSGKLGVMMMGWVFISLSVSAILAVVRNRNSPMIDEC